MPKFLVHRDTHVSHLGRTFKAGEVAEFDLPFVPDRDVQGRVITDAEGKPQGKPMRVNSNLELMPEDEKAEPTSGARKK